MESRKKKNEELHAEVTECRDEVNSLRHRIDNMEKTLKELVTKLINYWKRMTKSTS